MNLVDSYLNSIQGFKEYDNVSITYEKYCETIDLLLLNNSLSEGLFDSIRQLNISRELVKVFRDLKSGLISISKDFKLNLKDIVIAFKQREVFNVLKGFGFNIKLMVRCLSEFSNAVHGGLFTLFKELFRLKIFKKLRSGAIKIDEVLKRYPKLTKISGFVIAGLLLFIWLNMTFIGNLDYDFNFSDIASALHGSFSIADLFMSPEGLMLFTLFGTGSMLGLSVPWLGKSLYNLTLAIMYTGYVQSKEKDLKQFALKIKKKLKREKIS